MGHIKRVQLFDIKPGDTRKKHRAGSVKECHVTSSKQAVSRTLTWSNSGPLETRYFYLLNAVFGPTLPSFHLKTETDGVLYTLGIKLKSHFIKLYLLPLTNENLC